MLPLSGIHKSAEKGDVCMPMFLDSPKFICRGVPTWFSGRDMGVTLPGWDLYVHMSAVHAHVPWIYTKMDWHEYWKTHAPTRKFESLLTYGGHVSHSTMSTTRTQRSFNLIIICFSWFCFSAVVQTPAFPTIHIFSISPTGAPISL